MSMSNKRVLVSAKQVAYFRSRWPCCTLEGAITFEYSTNGYLVDIEGADVDMLDGEDERALLALSQDAQKGYGRIING